VLTGSAVPDDDIDRHTGAGRFSFLRMRPLSLYESGHPNGQISLGGLIAGATPRTTDPGLTIREIADRITIGGWPAQQTQPVTNAARDYLEQIRTVDVSRVANTRRDPNRVSALMASLARNVATEVKNATLAVDAGGADGPLSEHTVADYLDALARLMVIEDQPAWAPHMRSKAILRRSPKRHFTCPSLAVAALGAGPDRLLADLNLFGLLFESLVVRDLRILSQPLEGRVLHYRDNYGAEVDAVVQLVDGRWAAFEIKLGAGEVDAGAESLRRFTRQVDTSRYGEPVVLGVICATGYGYQRDDGIAVIPIGALGP
jgi:predicted AAA+ superfamily ATPase